MTASAMVQARYNSDGLDCVGGEFLSCVCVNTLDLDLFARDLCLLTFFIQMLNSNCVYFVMKKCIKIRVNKNTHHYNCEITLQKKSTIWEPSQKIQIFEKSHISHH